MTTFSDLADILGSDDDDEEDEEYVPSDEGSSSEEEGEEEVQEEKTKAGGDTARAARKRGASPVEEASEVSAKKERPEEETAQVCSDSLWSSFLQRAGRPVKRDPAPAPVQTTQIREFAGQTVRVTVTETETEAEAVEKAPEPPRPDAGTREDAAEPSTSPPTSAPVANGVGRKGGVSNLLANLKKPKLTVLEKSKLDWNSFVTTEGIKEDLTIHNRGKDGYLEKMAFLERTDYRQFEIERDLRQGVKRNSRK